MVENNFVVSFPDSVQEEERKVYLGVCTRGTYLALYHTECPENKSLQFLLAYQVHSVLPDLLDPTRGPVLMAHILDNESE